MNPRSLLKLAVLVALPLTACVITPRNPGDVTFNVSFQGGSCPAAVRDVKISISGEADIVQPCTSGGTMTVVLPDLYGGYYSYTAQARDYNGSVLYSASGSFVIDGSVSERIDLKPATSGGGAAYAYLVWTFPPNATSENPSCSQAGVDRVLVSIDGADWLSYKCTDGNTADGTPTPYLTPGTHTIELSAVDVNGYEYYALRSTLPLSNQPTLQQYDLDWAVGGATVRWTLTSGGTTVSCGSAGISTVYVNFQDAQGNLVYGDVGDPQPCMNLAVVYSYLKPGTYRVFLSAAGSGGRVYESPRTGAPMVTVTAARFTSVNDGPNVLLNRVQ